MPKKLKKSKPRKIKKLARKPARKSTKKPVKKKVLKKKTARKTAKPVRKPATKKAVATVKAASPPMKIKTPAVPMIAEKRVGIVTHYYSHLNVAVVKLDQGSLQVGDPIRIKGHTTDLQQRVASMQIEHQPIQRAEIGQEFGLKVTDHVREHDVVSKVLG